MRKDIRLQFDCEIASEKGKHPKKNTKRIIYLSDHLCSSVKEQVSESNVLFLPAYQKKNHEKMNTIISTLYID